MNNSVSFESSLTACFQEGHWRHLHEGPQYLDGWKATILVARDSDRSDSWLTVAFATSDLTARGVDSDAYRECSDLSVEARVPVSRVDACAVYGRVESLFF